MAIEQLIERFKDTVQDCNLNFLLGSGMSCPYLPVLGSIENLLTEVETSPLPLDRKTIIRASLYWKYFSSVMAKNLQILKNDAGAQDVLLQYKAFLSCLNSILVKRKVTILSKEANLFTTNVDIF